MDKSELDRRVEEEAGEARRRWYGREEGRVWKGLTETERSDWISVARPLVERIAELEQAPANVDAPQGETLIKRVGREVGPALDRWQACDGGNHSSMAAAIGPLVATAMGLESDLKTARDSGQAYADKLTAAQTAGRDQASEIDDLRARLSDANEDNRSMKAHALDALADLTRERETVRKLLADNAALETTVDVLAGRLAARGQS